MSRFSSLFLHKGLSLVLSFIINGLLLGSMVCIFTPYKIYWDKKEVTDIRIAPREKLFIPPMSEILGETEEDFLRAQSSSEPSRGGRSTEGKKPEKGNPAPEDIRRGEGQKTSVPGGRSFSSEGSSQFGFNLSSLSSLEGSPEGGIPLSPYKGFEDLIPGGTQEGVSSQKLNLGGSAGRGISPLSALPVSSGLGLSGEGGGYDLSPWAEKVMDSVNKNWVIPVSQKKAFIEKVKISVIVQKSGKLLFMETTKSSAIASFNRAALEALTLSAPFPVLPPDFPGETLQLDFVFDYVHVQD